MRAGSLLSVEPSHSSLVRRRSGSGTVEAACDLTRARADILTSRVNRSTCRGNRASGQKGPPLWPVRLTFLKDHDTMTHGSCVVCFHTEALLFMDRVVFQCFLLNALKKTLSAGRSTTVIHKSIN